MLGAPLHLQIYGVFQVAMYYGQNKEISLQFIYASLNTLALNI